MPYRDDQAALEARRDELRHELSEATRKVNALAGAVGDQEKLAHELALVEERLLRAGARRLPLLDDIRVASPCNASWEAMVGDEHVRFCGSCEKNVYNLSSMARDEAERLLAERSGSICVRLYQRADGTVLTADCPVGVRKKRIRRAVVSTAGAGALALAANAVFAVQGEPCPRSTMMGKVAVAMEPTAREIVPVMGSTVAPSTAAPQAPKAPPPPPKVSTPPAPSGKDKGRFIMGDL